MSQVDASFHTNRRWLADAISSAAMLVTTDVFLGTQLAAMGGIELGITLAVRYPEYAMALWQHLPAEVRAELDEWTTAVVQAVPLVHGQVPA